MTKIQEEPIVGNDYQLFDGESAKTQSSFKGIYIGMNPVFTRNKWAQLFEPVKPEGHLFLTRGKEGKPEVYCTFSDERKDCRQARRSVKLPVKPSMPSPCNRGTCFLIFVWTFSIPSSQLGHLVK